jgi:GT2 family glycosyltransferase
MLVGNDIQFTPGDLEKFDKYMKSIPDRNKKGIACGNQGYSCFAILPHTLNIVGYFDENIYPAYLEDCDYSWRCKLAGLDNSDVPDTQLVHGEAPSWGSSTIYSNKDFRNKNGYTHGLNFVYYNKKWGGNNGEEKFTRPYNDETNSIKFWEPCTNRVAW